MKELRPLDTLFLTLATVIILIAVSFIDVPSGLTKIDIFAALNSTDDTPSQIVESSTPSDDYAVDYVQNDIVSTQPKIEKPRAKTALVKEATIEVAPTTEQRESTQNSASATPKTQEHSTLSVPEKNKELIDHQQNTTPCTATSTAVLEGNGGTAIENEASLRSFFDRLNTASSGDRPVRIAVLGDSFIEGDILTQDLREMFQDRFGGSGVGFVPLASTVSGFRQTITHTFAGWANHCISTSSKRGNYTISSYTFTPSDGSTARYLTSTKRRHVTQFSRARLLFINAGSASIGISINNTEQRKYTPPSSNRMQLISVAQDSIKSIEYSFRTADQVTVYGAFFDGERGVAVDNYSVRGNSGISLATTSIDLMSQMNSLVPLDLIILEYGLNVATADTRNYTQYHAQMQKSIEHLREAFPNAAILIMSVADRAHRTAAGWQTMPGIVAMERTQRQLAADCNVAFWSTMKNMQALGGMGVFVEKGWAAKDYTHLSHRGGRAVARSLFDAIMVEYGN